MVSLITTLLVVFSLHYDYYFGATKSLIIENKIVEVSHTYKTIPITVSVYQPKKEQTDDNPYDCACNNFHINEKSYYIWVAISRDLSRDYLNCGDTIIVTKNGQYYEFVVADVMASDWVRKIDILIPPYIDYKEVYNKNNFLFDIFKTEGQAKIKKIIHNYGEARNLSN